MEEILLKCSELNQLILDSAEYKNYIQARTALRSNEQLYNSLMEFKNMYTDIMQYTEGNPYDEILRMYSDNDELIHNSTVNEYLRAESAFSHMVREVLDTVYEGINIQ